MAMCPTGSPNPELNDLRPLERIALRPEAQRGCPYLLVFGIWNLRFSGFRDAGGRSQLID